MDDMDRIAVLSPADGGLRECTKPQSETRYGILKLHTLKSRLNRLDRLAPLWREEELECSRATIKYE